VGRLLLVVRRGLLLVVRLLLVVLLLLLLREDLAAQGLRHGAQGTSRVRRSQRSVLGRHLGRRCTVIAIRGGAAAYIGLLGYVKRG